MQASLAVSGGVPGLVAWWQSGGVAWLLGALVLLANWPFTVIGITPTNQALTATPAGQAGVETRALMRRWGRLHAVRSVFGSAATVLFLAGLLAGEPAPGGPVHGPASGTRGPMP